MHIDFSKSELTREFLAANSSEFTPVKILALNLVTDLSTLHMERNSEIQSDASQARISFYNDRISETSVRLNQISEGLQTAPTAIAMKAIKVVPELAQFPPGLVEMCLDYI